MTSPSKNNDLLEAYRKAHKSLVNFRYILLTNDPEQESKPAPFHYKWSDDLLNGSGNQGIEAYRESAKSNYVLRAFPLYCLTFPEVRRDYIVIIKNNARGAESKLKEIETEYLSNKALSWNLVKMKEQSGKVFSVDVKDENNNIINVRIEAFGKGSSVRGLANLDRRPKIVLADDLQDREDSRSDTVLEKDWQWFMSDVAFLGKYCRIFVIGNNLGEKCIVEQVMNNADTLGYKCYRIPCIDDKGKPAWPDRTTTEEIYAEKEKFKKIGQLDLWYREKMCIALAEENRIFKREDFRYYVPHLADRIYSNCNITAVLDPAVSETEHADFRAITVVGCDQDDSWFVLDVPYGRWDPTETINIVFDTVKKWKLKVFHIEEGVFKKYLEHWIFKEMSKRGIFFNIAVVKHKASKTERIKALQPRFKAHTIYFPEWGEWLTELESELLGFTAEGSKTLHDDLIDSLAYHVQIVKTPYQKQDRPLYSDPNQQGDGIVAPLETELY